MQNKKTIAPQMVREYKIGSTTYIVKSGSKPDAKEDAVTKVKRLIKSDLRKPFQK
ncbi:MAG: transposon-encoded TnpW family protein [Lachnospiraceae bacterium]